MRHGWISSEELIAKDVVNHDPLSDETLTPRKHGDTKGSDVTPRSFTRRSPMDECRSTI